MIAIKDVGLIPRLLVMKTWLTLGSLRLGPLGGFVLKLSLAEE